MSIDNALSGAAGQQHSYSSDHGNDGAPTGRRNSESEPTGPRRRRGAIDLTFKLRSKTVDDPSYSNDLGSDVTIFARPRSVQGNEPPDSSSDASIHHNPLSQVKRDAVSQFKEANIADRKSNTDEQPITLTNDEQTVLDDLCTDLWFDEYVDPDVIEVNQQCKDILAEMDDDDDDIFSDSILQNDNNIPTNNDDIQETDILDLSDTPPTLERQTTNQEVIPSPAIDTPQRPSLEDVHTDQSPPQAVQPQTTREPSPSRSEPDVTEAIQREPELQQSQTSQSQTKAAHPTSRKTSVPQTSDQTPVQTSAVHKVVHGDGGFRSHLRELRDTPGPAMTTIRGSEFNDYLEMLNVGQFSRLDPQNLTLRSTTGATVQLGVDKDGNVTFCMTGRSLNKTERTGASLVGFKTDRTGTMLTWKLAGKKPGIFDKVTPYGLNLSRLDMTDDVIRFYKDK